MLEHLLGIHVTWVSPAALPEMGGIMTSAIIMKHAETDRWGKRIQSGHAAWEVNCG